MDYRLTRHATDMLEKREIAVAWVERVLREPERTETDSADPTLEHHLGRIADFDNRVLRVIVRPSGGYLLVVTAYFDRRSTRS